MTIISEEELAAIQKDFPEGSEIELPSGGRGLLNFIDAGGSLHVDMEDGRSLTLAPDKDRFAAEPPDTAKMDAVKLYMPISATLGASPEESAEIPQSELPGFQAEIAEAMSRIARPVEVDRGLMHWYCDSDSVNRKVHSVKLRPARRGGAVWCVADCKLREPLSPKELEKLKGFIELHAATTWSDLLQKNPVRAGDSALTVQIWKKEGWSIQTERERFGADIGGRISGLINRRAKSVRRHWER